MGNGVTQYPRPVLSKFWKNEKAWIWLNNFTVWLTCNSNMYVHGLFYDLLTKRSCQSEGRGWEESPVMWTILGPFLVVPGRALFIPTIFFKIILQCVQYDPPKFSSINHSEIFVWRNLRELIFLNMKRYFSKRI